MNNGNYNNRRPIDPQSANRQTPNAVPPQRHDQTARVQNSGTYNRSQIPNRAAPQSRIPQQNGIPQPNRPIRQNPTQQNQPTDSRYRQGQPMGQNQPRPSGQAPVRSTPQSRISRQPSANTKRTNPLLIYIAAGAAVLIIIIIIAVIISSVSDKDPGTSLQSTADNAGVGLYSPTESDVTEAATQAADTPVSTPDVWTAELAETPDAGQDYIDKLVFLGDSTTYGLRHYSMLHGGKDTTQVWTPSSGTLSLFSLSSATVVYPETDDEITIEEALTRKQPEYLVITIGVNGIASMKESVFKASYGWLIDTVRKVSPDTKIICQTMFPVAANYESLGSINNEKIQNGNKWILDVANEKKVKYLDTYSVLVGDDGWLPEELQNGDGLHLNTDGFNIELENLRTHAYPG